MTLQQLLKTYQNYTKGKTPKESKMLWAEYRKLKKEIIQKENINNTKSVKKTKKKKINKFNLNVTNKHILQFVENNKNKLTDAEQRYKNLLDRNGADYQYQVSIKVNDKYYIMDFFFPKSKTCVEIDGGYHFTKEQKIKDEKREKDLESVGISVIRYKNEDIF